MVDLPEYACACGRSYEVSVGRWRCDCGGVLDLAAVPLAWSPRGDDHSLWRYADAIPVPGRRFSLGEGMTPLVEASLGGAGSPGGDDGVWFKVEYVSPTGSFKDRGAVVLAALADLIGAPRLVADSSGNAGTAMAAYAARAGVAAEIFVPSGVSEKKLAQIRGHGARVTVVEGPREETARAAVERVEATGAFYASHVYNPFFYEGTKTYALEVFEQLGGTAPDALVLPAGNGTLVIGAYLGFAGLRAAGLVDRVPRIVAVQAELCAPVAEAFTSGRADVEAWSAAGTAEAPGPGERTVAGRTVAEGIAIAAPARGARILEIVRETGGAVVTVSEKEIALSHAALAARGLWVEPTGAVAYAAVRGLRSCGSPLTEGTVVAPLCGSGLKASM
ncbi:pyridoxal-phosphate dependent enzyme [Sphaerisporangium corydalis]|uniref:Pyridoxal-phosphate dependent enzyme n=1 Tax=Sphaerisporangium corydalis TaxID=1441875 RepID=A0ABV9E7M8_9ACTN|nr:pyridoxal-phosphate dependent enzyme [Sphaerisporangium corydalis]